MLASIICGAIIFLAFVVGIVAICYLRHLSLPSRYSISSSLPLRVSESQVNIKMRTEYCILFNCLYCIVRISFKRFRLLYYGIGVETMNGMDLDSISRLVLPLNFRHRLDDEESVSRIDAVSRPPRPPSLITGHALPVADGAMEEKATEVSPRCGPSSLRSYLYLAYFRRPLLAQSHLEE